MDNLDKDDIEQKYEGEVEEEEGLIVKINPVKVVDSNNIRTMDDFVSIVGKKKHRKRRNEKQDKTKIEGCRPKNCKRKTTD